MSYIIGNNPMGRSYIVGYDLENGASHPHHRAAHGSKTLNMDEPADQTHILWGALVGGPDADDWHRDITKDYIYNEVAVDYNAGFTGACAGLYEYFGRENGDEPIDDFPPSEQSLKGEINQYYIEARVVQENTARSQVEVKVYNDSCLPPKYVDDIKCRYFFNVNELAGFNQSVDDIIVEIYYDQENANTNGESFATISDPVKWDDDGTYYVEISWKDCEFYGTRVFHFGLIADMDENFKTNWDPTNDYSRQGLEISEDELLLTERIPVYLDDELVWGSEPDKGANTDILYGDADCNGEVNINDAVVIMSYTTNSSKYSISNQGMDNGDVYARGDGISNMDALSIQKRLAEIISELPESYNS